MAANCGDGPLKEVDPNLATGSFELVLEEQARSAKVGHGRNPYDAVPKPGASSPTTRRSDLRRLSEWIRTKKHVEKLKSSETPKDPKEDPLP